MFVFLYWPGDKLECAPLRRQLRWDHDCDLERQISGGRQCLPTALEPTVGRNAVGRRAAALVMSGFAVQRLQDTDQSASDSLSADSISLSAHGLSTCALRNTWRPSAGWGEGDGECLGPFHVRVIARGLLRHKWVVPLVDPPQPLTHPPASLTSSHMTLAIPPCPTHPSPSNSFTPPPPTPHPVLTRPRPSFL